MAVTPTPLRFSVKLTDEEFKTMARRSDPLGYINRACGMEKAKNSTKKGTRVISVGHGYYEDGDDDGWQYQHKGQWEHLAPVGAGGKAAPKVIPQPSEAALKRVHAAFNIEELKKACSGTPREWFNNARDTRTNSYYKTPQGEYIYHRVKGGSTLLAVAHLDSVQAGRDVVDSRETDGTIRCPVLDDRLGVYTILFLLPKLGIKPDLLLCDMEESGKSTAKVFALPGKTTYNWMVEFDRKGEDVVTYGFTDKTWVDTLKTMFDVGRGSFSDIAALTQVGSCGVNIGVGYENYHAANAFFDFDVYCRQVARFVDFWELHKDTRFEHVVAPPVQHVTHCQGATTYNKAKFKMDYLGAATLLAPRHAVAPPPIQKPVEALIDDTLAVEKMIGPVEFVLSGSYEYRRCVTKLDSYAHNIGLVGKLVEFAEKEAVDKAAELTDALRKDLWTIISMSVSEAAPGLCLKTTAYVSDKFTAPFDKVLIEPVIDITHQGRIYSVLNIHDPYDVCDLIIACTGKVGEGIKLGAQSSLITDSKAQEALDAWRKQDKALAPAAKATPETNEQPATEQF